MRDRCDKAVVTDRQLFTYNNDSKTLCGWASHLGIDPGTLRSRVLYQGLPVEDALNKPVHGRSGKKYQYNGREQTLKEWAEELGVSYSTLRRRVVSQNMTLKQAAEYEKRPNKRPTSTKLYSVDGKSQSLTEWAEQCGVGASTIRARLKKGIPFSEAIKPRLKKSDDAKLYEYQDRKQTLQQWADELDISEGILISRVTSLGMSVGEAVFTPIRIGGRHEYSGRFLKLEEWAHELGIEFEELQYLVVDLGQSLYDVMANFADVSDLPEQLRA